MADAPKDEGGLTMFEQVMLFLFVIFFLSMVWYRAQDFLYYYEGATTSSIWDAIVAFFFNGFLPVMRVVAFIVSGFAIWGIMHNMEHLNAINKEEREFYSTQKSSDAEATPLKNDKWERVIAHLNSANAADWRLAIIEADVLLDELLKSAGYHGETLGERLKSVERSDFLTIDNAWEAHRVRNQVAHQGADFPLNEREAKRAIALYESVFKEFKII